MAKKIKPNATDRPPRRGQSSEEYWRERESRQRAENIRNEAKTAEKINNIFKSIQDSIQQEIEAFYQRYASKEGITLTEARGRVSRIDMEQYERLAKKYVAMAHSADRDGAFTNEANEQMRLYNLTMKVNRLEMLKARCGIRTMEGYTEAQKLINEELEERAYSEYHRLAGILGNSVQFNENMVRSIVNASYQTATWSQRLWTNQSALSSMIGTRLAQGILAGKGSIALARDIQKLTGQSTFACQRLMRTELRRVQTEAALQSMTDNGVTHYKYLVANGVNPCDECVSLDGKVFPLKEMAVGVNAPPKHPLCHCCTCPAIDEEKWDRWLDGPAQAGVPWGEFDADNYTNPDFTKNSYHIQSDNGIMKVETGGHRNEVPLTEEQVNRCIEYAVELGMPREQIAYRDTYWTGYNPAFDILLLGTDAFPNPLSETANGRLSYRASIAHEIVGHRESTFRGTARAKDDPLDEAQASLRASRFAPGLTDEDRELLIQDARDRLAKINKQLEDVISELDVFER